LLPTFFLVHNESVLTSLGVTTMPPWLTFWIARFASGERMRKGESADYQYWFGVLFLFPLTVGLFMKFGARLFDRSALIVWLGVTLVAVADFFVARLWARFVPAMVSLVLAALVWSVGFWIAWHRGL
jgi:hypothetical protein